ncbi:DUF1707 domain-containing protein [Actinosynnema sp. NPDC020468]|uniref:DUF1707 SHOCT-like domain-containing protein n=1 Tax=Actinosynnema sp. NPDC020468 TaxID=3154488 RepID=UPI0033EFF383
MTQPVRPEDVRASDVERDVVAQRLRRAHAEGSLDLAEFDVRVAEAWRARTRGELRALLADLPAEVPVGVPVVVPARPVRSGGRTALKVLTTIWMSVSALNFALWLLVSVLGGEGFVHPWFLWVAVPPGSVLGVIWLVTARPRHP